MADANIVTSIDLTDPQKLMAFAKAAPDEPMFMLNRYFPCNPSTDIFPTAEVLIDYNTTNRKKAPFMKAGYRETARDTYITDKFEPARIAEGRPLTQDMLVKRGFGEAVFSDMTPDQRAATLAIADFADLKKRIKRTLEKMAADVMLDNAYTAKYMDKQDMPEEVTLSFNEGGGVDTQYTPAAKWDAAGANILGDLKAMAKLLRYNGSPGSEVILGAGAADALVADATIQKLLDIKRYELGNIEPSITGGNPDTVLIGQLNIDGVRLNLIQYSGVYENDSGVLTPYIPDGRIIMTAPACGKSLFGAITQLEQGDGQFHTYSEMFVPKYTWNSDLDKRTFMLSCKPLLVPRIKKCWASATVL